MKEFLLTVDGELTIRQDNNSTKVQLSKSVGFLRFLTGKGNRYDSKADAAEWETTMKTEILGSGLQAANRSESPHKQVLLCM